MIHENTIQIQIKLRSEHISNIGYVKLCFLKAKCLLADVFDMILRMKIPIFLLLPFDKKKTSRNWLIFASYIQAGLYAFYGKSSL